MASRVPMWRRYLRFFGPDVRADVQDELEFHIETKIAELVERGRTREEARQEALRRFGDFREVSEICRRIGETEMRKAGRTNRMSEIWYDVRHGIRRLVRAPRFSVLAVLTLAAGITGAASLFSLIDAWVIRAVRFPQPQELTFTKGLNIRSGRQSGISFADFQDMRERSRQYQSLAAYTSSTYVVAMDQVEGNEVERVTGATVSPNFFSTLQVPPALGRGFLEAESERGQRHVVIVSHGFWKVRLNGDESAIGKQLRLDGEPYTIVGVLPEKFHFTLVGRANLWTPLAPAEEERSKRQSRYLQLIGRLRAGAGLEQARQELSSIAAQLAGTYPDTNRDMGIQTATLQNEIGEHTGEQVLLVVFAVTLGLLLLACSNVANLLLVRSLGMKRQVSIQMSVGATRGRIVRQALVESLALFLSAAALGTLGGWWLTGLITRFVPYTNRGYLPNYGEASLSWTVLGFVLGLTLVTGLVFGLAPALENARTNVLSVLKESGSSVSQSPKAKRLGLVFVTAQIALAMILLSATAILVQSFRGIWNAPLGFDSHGLLTFYLELDERRYPDETRRRIFFESIGGAVARFVPFGNSGGSTGIRARGQEAVDSRQLPVAGFNAVSPEYFSTMRIPLHAGRVFEPADTHNAPAVAVVNDAFAKKLLAGREAVGEQVWLSRGSRWARVVGVVAEVKVDGESPLGFPQIYVPFAQSPSAGAHVVMRASTDALPEIRKKIAALDSQLPVFDAKTMDDRLNEIFSPYQIISGMLVWFGALALALAAVGVYAVVSYSVSQRTREIGIRAALGAGHAALLRMFLRQGMWVMVVGLTPGILGSAAVAAGLKTLFTHNIMDGLWLSVAVTAGIVGATVLLAALVPARRAAGADPLLAIRAE